MRVREPYFVYVDEAGDRGWGGRSSPFFVVAAVVVRGSDDPMLRSLLDKINADLGKPGGHILHWAENIRDHAQRKHVARLLNTAPMTCVAVLLDKESLMGRGEGLSDPARQYNYLARRLIERVSWLIDRRHGSGKLIFAHVRRFKYEALESYLDHLRRTDSGIRWEAIKSRYPIIEQPNKIRGLQVADLVAGCVYSAVRKDGFGDHEPAYLREIASRFWVGPTRKLHSYGLNLVGSHGRCHDQFAWWSEVARRAEA